MPHKQIKKVLKKTRRALTRPRRAGLTREEAQKARDKARAYIEKGIREGDILPDLPGPDLPLYSPVGGLAGRLNPYLGAVLGAYAMLENTEQWWGPRLWEGYGQGYPEPLRPQALMGAPGVSSRQAMSMVEDPFMVEDVSVKPTRKITKANKATKMAWKMLTKGRKGKLTQSACQKLLKKCSMIASKANPNTKSRIGTAKNGTTRCCKKIRKSIWGTNKRN